MEKITKNALKEKIFRDSKKFKTFVDKIYLNEMDLLIKVRIRHYDEIVINGLDTELQLNLFGEIREFIQSGITEAELKKRVIRWLK